MNIKIGDTIYICFNGEWTEPAQVLSRVDDALSIAWDIRGIEYYGICEVEYLKWIHDEDVNGEPIKWLEIDETDVRVSFSVDLDNIETGDYVL